MKIVILHPYGKKSLRSLIFNRVCLLLILKSCYGFLYIHDMDTDKDMAQGIESAGEDTGLAAAAHEIKDKPGYHIFFRICALAGLLCAISGWLLFYFKPVAAVTIGCVGICLSILGLWSGKGCLRSLSVTGLVAAAVLVLLYVAFYWGLAWGVSHL